MDELGIILVQQKSGRLVDEALQIVLKLVIDRKYADEDVKPQGKCIVKPVSPIACKAKKR